MPSPDGHTSGIASHRDGRRLGQVGWVWHPAGLPQGLPHASPRAEPDNVRAGIGEGCPRAAARSG